MSDYLGPNQTRVLDPTNRSFEELVYQKQKPPLSSELNLNGMVSSNRDKNLSSALMPSGWSIVGTLRDDISASDCASGDVLCSSTFARNTLKLIALDKGVEKKDLIAWVNGWRVLVQGSSSTDENNIITLPDPPSIGSRVEFVFLEVWRKLIEPDDTVYKYGNVLYGGTNPSNDLIDPAINIETSLRVQIQYRIRVSYTDIETYPDGFDPNRVFVQGPLDEPISTCSQAYFSPVPGDIGLWRAGAGDTAAQSTLQTVDGYTYAIPMFAIQRRNTGTYDPDSRSNGSEKTLANYQAGYASDRPDNRYNDWIVAGDILDLRRRVAPGFNYKEICSDGFQKLIRGDLRSKMVKSTLGEDHYGVTIVQADAVSDVDKAGSNKIATGDGERRIFSNASIDQPRTYTVRTVYDKIVGTGGANWAASDRVQILLSSYPSGSTVASIESVYTSSNDTITGLTYYGEGTGDAQVEVGAGSSEILGSSDALTIEFTISYPAGPYGLTGVPDTFLEFRKEDTTLPIASKDADIRVRAAAPVVTNDGTKFNMLSNRGGSTSELYDFGHQMIYHAVGSGTQSVSFPRTINGYNIIGLASVRIDSTARTLGTVSRTAGIYTVNFDTTAVSGQDVELYLYTDSKFFDTNKQGRAIIDTYEMTEITPVESAGGGLDIFTLDTTNQEVLALASYETENGIGYAWVNGTRTELDSTSNNRLFPNDGTATRPRIKFSSAPSLGATIEVPVLLRSAVGSSEGYTFFYQETPYQGWLDSTTSGKIEAEGPSIVTTAGSGSITDATYTGGQAAFASDTTAVYGINTEWLSNVRSGYQIWDGNDWFEIESVYDDETLFLKNIPSTDATQSYTIRAFDQPQYEPRNVIDRLPALDSNNDASGHSEYIDTAITDAYPILETRIVNRVQDITDMSANAAIIGENTADRGRSTINLPGTPFGLSNLGLKYEKLSNDGSYQKTYQSYIFNEENTGRLRMMVVGSETDNTSLSNFFNEKSDSDVVDVFELPGLPITKRRTE